MDVVSNNTMCELRGQKCEVEMYPTPLKYHHQPDLHKKDTNYAIFISPSWYIPLHNSAADTQTQCLFYCRYELTQENVYQQIASLGTKWWTIEMTSTQPSITPLFICKIFSVYTLYTTSN
ncbi:hypothetical protein XENOCAPTIV_007626 [Xenoophorus captivus]|uniref:Uncharacterized protein n=1 Tax=Xenoophorus captivus TaxID=1517983 RepID=A0ABV0S7N6_9TELE